MKKTMKFALLTMLISFLAFPLWSQEVVNYEKDPATVTFVKNTETYFSQAYQSYARQHPVWQSFKKTNPQWWVMFEPKTGLPHRAFGPAVSLQGNGDPVQSVKQFLNNELKGFKVPVNELNQPVINESEKYTYINFTQFHKGLRVLWSNATFQLTKNGELVKFGLDVYRNINLDINPSISESDAALYAQNGISIPVNGIEVEKELSILPVMVGESGTSFKLVFTVFVEGTQFDGTPARYFTLVDAKTGEVYYRQNQIHNCAPQSADVKVVGDVEDSPLTPAVSKNLKYLKVVVNGQTYYTDTAGLINLPNLNAPALATFYLEGTYSKVIDDQTGSTASFSDTVRPGVNNIIDFTTHAKNTEIAAYANVSRVHDHMKKYTEPSFTNLDIQMQTFVDITSGSCNAFYDGNVNFFAAGGNCPPTSLISDVVFHEYGHGINGELYDHFGGVFANGGLGEGYADVWGFSITLDPVLGRGFSGGANTFVRRYDINKKVYPQDLVGQVHADGEIIAGAWWDTYLNLNKDQDTLMYLFFESQRNTPMAPRGAEGKLYSDILIEALMVDDDDNNLANGTPHFTEISTAFALHGITLLADAVIDHDEPLIVPEKQVINIDADLMTSRRNFVGDMKLHYRMTNTGSFTSVVMASLNPIKYRATIPAQPKGTIIEYYFSVDDILGNDGVIDPVQADATDPNLRYFIMVGFKEIETHDYDNTLGFWKVNPDNNDNALTGLWTIDSPVPTYNDGSTDPDKIVQTGTDHTPNSNSNLCAFTGNAAPGDGMGTNDVDKGRTTLQTPDFDMTAYVKPAISYWRWYINNPPSGANPGNDVWQAFISNDGQNWVRVERTGTSDRSWRRNVVLVEDYVTPTATVSMRFIAQDSLIPGTNLDGGSIVEAAIDDVFTLDLDTLINTGIESTELFNAVKLFPNPSNGLVTIKMINPEMRVEQIHITDLQGRIVYQTNNINDQVIQLDLSNLGAGIYMAKIQVENQVIVRRLVIQHASN
jgi:Zn-dependent metalloprotease